VFHSVVDGFAILRERALRCDKITQFPLRKADCLSAMTFKQRDLPEALRVRLGACSVELTLTSVCPKIEHPRMCFAVLIWTNFQGWFFHEANVAESAENVNYMATSRRQSPTLFAYNNLIVSHLRP